MKNITKIIILSITLVLLVVIVSFNISGGDSNDSEYNYTSSWTKAICNENSCQDYIIYCNGDEFVRQTPITGAVMSIPENWEDPRDEGMKEKICD